MTAKKRALRKDSFLQTAALPHDIHNPHETAPLAEAAVGPGAKATAFVLKREDLLNKYWELANLHPEVTKGTISGQLKALDSLCEELGVAPRPHARLEEDGEAAIYRSAWMRRKQAASPSNA
jgi:hypothetical protein